MNRQSDRFVSIKGIFCYMVKHVLTILLFALVGAVMFGGIYYFKATITSGNEVAPSIEELEKKI